MALDVAWRNVLDWLSRRKKWTSVILWKVRRELGSEWLKSFETWALKYHSETDVVVALWRNEKWIEDFQSELSWETLILISDFTAKRVSYILNLKNLNKSWNNWDSL